MLIKYPVLLMTLVAYIFCAQVSQSAAPPVDANTVAMWRFDDADGTLDSSPNGFNLTPKWIDEPQSGMIGKYGSAVLFDGIDDYVYYPESGSTALDIASQITIEAWIEPYTLDSVVLEKEGAYSLITVGAGNKLLFSIYGGGSDSLEGNTAITTGSWHHVAGTFDGSTMKVYLDGNLDGQKTTTSYLAVNDNNVLIGYRSNPLGLFFDGKIDELRLSDIARPQSYFDTIDTTTGGATTYITLNGLTSAVLENDKVKYELSLTSGVQITRILNKLTASDCLRSGYTSPVFSMKINNALVSQSNFSVTGAWVVEGTGSDTLQISLGHSTGITLDLSATMDASAEVIWGMQINNTSGSTKTVRVGFPYLEDLKIGTTANMHYYFPFQGGWCGKKEYELGIGYGQRAWTQLISIFNPDGAGGIYLYPMDSTGELKTIMLRKQNSDGAAPTVYRSLLGYMDPGAVLPSREGAHATMYYTDKTIGTSGSMLLPDAVIGINSGLFQTALKSYSDWAHSTWYQHQPMVEWLKTCFDIPVAHDNAGNWGFENGFHPGSSYISAQQSRDGGLDHIIQWGGWWEYSMVGAYGADTQPYPWYKNNIGDYEYSQTWGGLTALTNEIDAIHAKGNRLWIYLSHRPVWKLSNIGLAHGGYTGPGNDWAYMDSPGHYSEAWNGPSTNYWSMCPAAQGWQDYMSTTAVRILRDTGVDGFFLDTAAEALKCYNPDHPHNESPAQDAATFVRKMRDAMKAENPESTFQTEFLGSDYNAQYIDASWVQAFSYDHPYGKLSDFNAYRINFFRFMFPEIKLAEWGYDADTYDSGIKRTFFSGIGRGRTDFATTAQKALVWETNELMRENYDVLAALDPEPLVPTLQSGVLANKFSTGSKTVYTIYNTNSYPVSGTVITVTTVPNTHFMELLYDKAPLIQVNGATTTVSMDIAADDVLYLAQFQNILDVIDTPTIDVYITQNLPAPRLQAIYGTDGANNKMTIKLFNNDALVDEIVVIK